MDRESRVMKNQMPLGFGNQENQNAALDKALSITKKDGSLEALDSVKLRQAIAWACVDFEEYVSIDLIYEEVLKNIPLRYGWYFHHSGKCMGFLRPVANLLASRRSA